MAKVLYDFQAMARNELAVKKGDLVTIRKLINHSFSLTNEERKRKV